MFGNGRNEIRRKGSFRWIFVFGTFSAFVAVSLVLPVARALPPNVECASDADCGDGSCCVSGSYRKSVQCQPTRTQGNECSPAFEVVHDLAVTFPDGKNANLKVHHHYCGCSQGLQCTNGTCIVNP